MISNQLTSNLEWREGALVSYNLVDRKIKHIHSASIIYLAGYHRFIVGMREQPIKALANL